MKVLAPDTKTYTKAQIDDLSMRKIFALLDDLNISTNSLYKQYIAEHTRPKAAPRVMRISNAVKLYKKLYKPKPLSYYPLARESVRRFPRAERPAVHFPLPVPPKPAGYQCVGDHCFMRPASFQPEPKSAYSRLDLAPKSGYSRLELSPKITYSRLPADPQEDRF